ncbi:TIGR04219 family outer membrane beta-barrel protein [Shewanella corallii]|uniref:TIGR04219 family outer membrane beta-barrel protein n=2 Tax=Shewanella TaxID=22 RepID=A0ABT0N7P8_9GAMM|nr:MULTISPECIES: TIGR04219 family outer membrane beta-barrel protein [Shewanella]MCL1038626.1 TIGR04219 family outer membrane beta-barrel protein [Shewanella submarina]MCL2914400.1 TIGR04219 family outer membrane beta-barrel protein [Shewanella corallii]
MKKTWLAGSVLMGLMASSAQADTLLGFKLGADFWAADTSGTFAQSGNPQQEFDYDSSTQGSIWVSLEHPIPFVPNVAIRENRLKENGSMTGADFTFGGKQFTGDVFSEADLSNTDFILYYELLDNDLVSLDVGGAYKQMHGSYMVSMNNLPTEIDLDDGVVMGYASAMVGIPGLGLFGFADVMAGLDESKVYDYQLGLGWQFDGIALDTRVRAGYREFNFDANNFSGLTSNMKFDGFFAGVEIDF